MKNFIPFFCGLLLSATAINPQTPRDAKEIFFADFSCDRILQIIRQINFDIVVNDIEIFIVELSDTVSNDLGHLLVDYSNYKNALPLQSNEDLTNIP